MGEAVDVIAIARRFSQSSRCRADKVPKYLRLSNAVLDAIESGEFRPGSQIPGERDLTDTLPVSLGTIQKAMSDLVEQGVVFRRAGKGKFVSGAGQHSDDLKVAKGDLVHFRFRAEGGHSLMPIYLHVESIEKVNSDAGNSEEPWAKFLDSGSSFVWIERILNVADQFIGLSRFYLPFERYGALLDYSTEELSGVTLRGFLNKIFGMPTLRFEHQIQCEQLPGGVCKRLNLHEGSFGTVWEIFGRSYRDAPATFQRVYLPAGLGPIEFSEKLD